MTTAQFFRISLFLPIIVGGVAWILSPDSIWALALFYGGLPYLPVAAISYALIGRAKSLAMLLVISLAMPIVLMLLLISSLDVLAVAALPVGFAYLILTWCLYGIARKMAVVRPLPTDEALEQRE